MRFRAASLPLLAALFGSLTLAAHADTVTYTFTGAGILAGTDFTYVDTAGFLSFSAGGLTPTTATDLIFLGDRGPLTSFEFESSTQFNLFSSTTFLDTTVPSYEIGAATTGEDIGNEGVLVITDAATATPEPSSLALLGTGVLGLVGVVRRRLVTA